MARKRQARKCKGHRTDGQPCPQLRGGRRYPLVHRSWRPGAAGEGGGGAPGGRGGGAQSVPAGIAGTATAPSTCSTELEHLIGVVTHFADFAESRLAALNENDWRLDDPSA